MAALDARRAEREAYLDEARARRDAIISRLAGQDDETARYLLHVGDFMRKLPPDILSTFKHDMQVLMFHTEQAVKQRVGQNEQ